MFSVSLIASNKNILINSKLSTKLYSNCNKNSSFIKVNNFGKTFDNYKYDSNCSTNWIKFKDKYIYKDDIKKINKSKRYRVAVSNLNVRTSPDSSKKENIINKYKYNDNIDILAFIDLGWALTSDYKYVASYGVSNIQEYKPKISKTISKKSISKKNIKILDKYCNNDINKIFLKLNSFNTDINIKLSKKVNASFSNIKKETKKNNSIDDNLILILNDFYLLKKTNNIFNIIIRQNKLINKYIKYNNKYICDITIKKELNNISNNLKLINKNEKNLDLIQFIISSNYKSVFKILEKIN